MPSRAYWAAVPALALILVLALALSGTGCDARSPPGVPASALTAAATTAATEKTTTTSAAQAQKARTVMTLGVRLGEGFQNNTVSVRVDGKEVFRKSGVSTDWTISRADSLTMQVDAPSVQLEVQVDDGPHVVRVIEPAQTPFVEVRFINGELQLHPMGEEPPML